MKVLLSVTLAGSLLGGTGANAQSLPSSGAAPTAHALTVQTADGNAATTNAAATATLLKDLKTGCAVRPIAGVTLDVITWSGSCVQGLAQGQGTLALWSQGKPVEQIIGDFDKGAARDGQVQIRWPDGSTYAGSAVASHMDGKGVLTTAAGDRFEGQWSAGHLSGQGSAVWANGDRYDGAWRDGKANGHGVQTWSDGRKYDGGWQNDQPNGHGIVTRKDGSRFEADFVDGRPGTPTVLTAVAITNAPATPSASLPAASQPDVASDDRNASGTASDSAVRVQPASIAGIAGKKLLAIDGSSITLTTNDDGIAREIMSPNGTSKKNLFAFLNDRVGSVSDGDDNDRVVGVFRLTAKGIITDYSDGRSEVLYPNDQGGVSMLLNAPTGEAYCMAWYPEGHQFSLEERKAALAQYASHLGLDEPHRKGAKPASKPSCGAPAAANAATSPSTQRAVTVPKLVPIPRPDKRAARQPVQAPAATPASFVAPSPRDSNQPVEVRTATVHTIDANAQSAAPNTAVASIAPGTAAGASASSCLSVESDGQHWAFRNHCGYDVQFAYCLMNAGDPLAGCSNGGISGSVAPNGSSALIADKSLSETNADHDFRWVACGGGAGEVVVHLDRSDPPAGRCVRPGAS
jgi:hypothetical protein